MHPLALMVRLCSASARARALAAVTAVTLRSSRPPIPVPLLAGAPSRSTSSANGSGTPSLGRFCSFGFSQSSMLNEWLKPKAQNLPKVGVALSFILLVVLDIRWAGSCSSGSWVPV